MIQEILKVLIYLAAPVLWLAFVTYQFFLGARTARRLRDHHKNTWLELGSPDLMRRASSKAKFVNYLSQRGYLTLGDLELTKLGDRARIALYVSVICMVILMLSGFTLLLLTVRG